MTPELQATGDDQDDGATTSAVQPFSENVCCYYSSEEARPEASPTLESFTNGKHRKSEVHLQHQENCTTKSDLSYKEQTQRTGSTCAPACPRVEQSTGVQFGVNHTIGSSTLAEGKDGETCDDLSGRDPEKRALTEPYIKASDSSRATSAPLSTSSFSRSLAPPKLLENQSEELNIASLDRLTSLAPEILTIIADFIQAAGSHDDVRHFARSSSAIRQAIQIVLYRYGVWNSLYTASIRQVTPGVRSWESFNCGSEGTLRE